MNNAAFHSDVDFLRGLFAILVMIGHATDIASLNSTQDVLLTQLVSIRFGLGFVWVVGFVVLSGFCVEGSCLRRYSTFRFRNFMALRVSRIFPLLIICCAAAGLVEFTIAMSNTPRPNMWLGNRDWPHLLTTALGLGAFFGAFACIAPAYTISYELVYYALWGGSRKFLKASSPVLRIVVSGVVITGLAFALDVFAPQFGSGRWTAHIPGFMFLVYVPWLVGAFLANYIELISKISGVAVLAKFSWILLLLFVFYSGHYWGMPRFEVGLTALTYYLALGGLFALVVIKYHNTKAQRAASPENRFLGELSYPLYLVHGPCIVFLTFLLDKMPLKLNFSILLFLLCGASILLAWGLTVLLERPLLAMRNVLFVPTSNQDVTHVRSE